MNPYLYEEHRPQHRRSGEHYRRTLIIGLVPFLLSLWLAKSHFPQIGPGLWATAGFSLSGLLALWSLKGMIDYPPHSRVAIWYAKNAQDLFPATLIVMQGWFVLITACLIWFSFAELGYGATVFHHILLLGILLLAPIRRILRGTEPQHPSPRRELLTEGIDYLNVCMFTLFIAACMSLFILPPGTLITHEVPLGLILVWFIATMVVLTCVVLFVDHIVRKMPPPPEAERPDSID